MKETKPEATLFDARVALIVALIAFATCFFVAGEARAQTVYPAITPEAITTGNDLRITGNDLRIYDYRYNYDTIVVPQKKIDTISVPVLCERVFVCAGITVRNGASYLQDVDLLGVEILFKQQERTLEWRTVVLPSPSKNGISIGIYATETKWVVTETRWLESKDKCYQLTPLTNE